MNNTIQRIPWEAFCWIGGLCYLAIISPVSPWSICPLHQLGFEFCPGCGLGRSVALLLHGEWRASWQAHPLGSVAIIILSYRIIQLVRNYIHTTKAQFHGPSN